MTQRKWHRCGAHTRRWFELTSQALEFFEFEVQLLLDGTDAAMVAALHNLAASSQQGDEALVFFGGHAIEHCNQRRFFGIRESHAPTAGSLWDRQGVILRNALVV